MWVYLRMKCWQMKSFLTSDHHSLFCTETDDLVWGGVSSLGYRDLLQRWFSSQRLGKSRQWGKTVFNYIGLYPVSFSWMYSTKLEPVDIYIYIWMKIRLPTCRTCKRRAVCSGRHWKIPEKPRELCVMSSKSGKLSRIHLELVYVSGRLTDI